MQFKLEDDWVVDGMYQRSSPIVPSSLVPISIPVRLFDLGSDARRLRLMLTYMIDLQPLNSRQDFRTFYSLPMQRPSQYRTVTDARSLIVSFCLIPTGSSDSRGSKAAPLTSTSSGQWFRI